MKQMISSINKSGAIEDKNKRKHFLFLRFVLGVCRS
ncbi:hypothetical protein NSE_0135 [Neorickettsia sennetsu str. Miyayama]|uniref:Uncharacterized protein n=1 Tax=Ehrlichia sennetsu (strain ATCC VR-367 / Miyayama) TaxID=222891 RepID=Q2GER1_EHRS3|nr:hypothetical protein NSE_0135 [Neorickettsia sennetsu str. Miyayama]